MPAEETFSKAERINRRRQIDTLFSGGSRAMSAFPLRMVYRLVERPGNEPKAQVLISVPKKCFKRAVKRNRVKRQIREAYRRNKHLLDAILSEEDNTGLDMAFIWISNKLTGSDVVNDNITNLLNRVIEKRQSRGNNNEKGSDSEMD